MRAFNGLAIDCESVLVDIDGRRLLDNRVKVGQIDVFHMVAMSSATAHSYDVQVHNAVTHPLLYVDYGQTVTVERFYVEPPLKRQFDDSYPGAGRKAKSFLLTADGTLIHADVEIESSLRAIGLYEAGAGACIDLPDEPAYKGYLRLSCAID